MSAQDRACCVSCGVPYGLLQHDEGCTAWNRDELIDRANVDRDRLAQQMYERTVRDAGHTEPWSRLQPYWQAQFLRHADVAIAYFREVYGE